MIIMYYTVNMRFKSGVYGDISTRMLQFTGEITVLKRAVNYIQQH